MFKRIFHRKNRGQGKVTTQGTSERGSHVREASSLNEEPPAEETSSIIPASSFKPLGQEPPADRTSPIKSASPLEPLNQEPPAEQTSPIKPASPLGDEFKYESFKENLGTFRLVTVQPSTNPSASIECTITHDQITGANYNALSYTWGDPNQKGTITLNGSPFSVSKNLFVALEHLRDKKEPLTLWIDAICINQADVDERTQQVKQMIDIYKNATQVLIWMGEEIENFEAAIDLMNWVKSVMSSGLWVTDNLVDFAGSPYRMEAWKALVELLKRPWWSRVWIIQEAVFGNDPVVICGRHRFEWELLQLLGESRDTWNKITWSLLQQEKPFYTGEFVHTSDRLNFITALRASHPIGPESLRALLHGVRTSEATDPRDKVFAMIGLLKNDINLCEVDYRKSIGQVYAEAAAGFLRLTGSPHFLSWTHSTTDWNGYMNRPNGIPSWAPSWIACKNDLMELQLFDDSMSLKDRESFSKEIAQAAAGSTMKTTFHIDVSNRAFFINRKPSPNWSTLFTSSDSPLPKTCTPRKSIYSATQDSRHAITFNAERGCLSVLGFTIDVLEDASPTSTFSFPVDGPASNWIRSTLNAKLGLPTSDWSDSDDAESGDNSEIAIQLHPIFWRTILADQWQGVRLGKDVTFAIPGVGSIPPSSIEELFKLRKAVASLENQVAFRWRKIFITKNTIGLAPPVAQAGDVIFGILGCDVPYLLRKCDRGYNFLGEW
jgi:hypothetical protein